MQSISISSRNSSTHKLSVQHINQFLCVDQRYKTTLIELILNILFYFIFIDIQHNTQISCK